MKNTKDLEKRCYTFSHFMLSPMAKGIQTLHSTVEIFNKYVPNPSQKDKLDLIDLEKEEAYKILFDWSRNHKTVISLNAGVSEDLDNLNDILQDPENFYPWSDFCEDVYSLKGIKTAISIVLTEKIYTTAALFRTGNFKWEPELGRAICLYTSKTDFEILESYGRFSTFEMDLINTLNNYRLAN